MLSAPTYGSLETTDGVSVTVSCNAGYMVNGGDTSITCTSGEWVGTMPICTIGKYTTRLIVFVRRVSVF